MHKNSKESFLFFLKKKRENFIFFETINSVKFSYISIHSFKNHLYLNKKLLPIETKLKH